jgi:NDP-sugar pyrophosphorylase family protein
MATLVSVPLNSPYGILDFRDETLICGFREKPELPFWINAGIYIINPAIKDVLPTKGDHETMTFPQLAEQGQLRVFKSRAFWRTIDTVKDLTDVRADFEQMLFGAFLQSPATSVMS